MKATPYLAWLAAVVVAGTISTVRDAHAAGELVEHFMRSTQHDALFQSAYAERQANLISSDIAQTAILPYLQLNSSRLETESSQRATVSLVQPVIDVARFVTFQEGAPRQMLAEATFDIREQDLAIRYFKAVSEFVRARENVSLNQSKIEAFDQQAKSARRAFELGTGTITDLRDAQVQLDQARADDIRLRAILSATDRQFNAITGNRPPANGFSLVRQQVEFSLRALDEHVDIALQNNPQLIASRQNEKISMLAITRAKGAFLPTVSVTATHTRSSRFSDNYVGVQVAIPLQASTFLQVSVADANASRAYFQTSDLEQRIRLDVQRLRELVESGKSEIAMRLASIESAKLSVEANEKSFRGGVRNKLDVINSIQVLYQVQQEHLNTVLVLAENLLQLDMQLATPVHASFKQIERILFTSELATGEVASADCSVIGERRQHKAALFLDRDCAAGVAAAKSQN